MKRRNFRKKVLQKNYLYVIVFFLLTPLSQVAAQNIGAWSLEQCIDYALDHNIQIHQQEIQAKINENDYNQSRINMLPSVNASSNYSLSLGRALDQTTYQFTNNQKVQSSNVSLNSSLTLFNGLQKYNTIRQNHFNLLASLQEVEAVKNDVSLNVASAYLQILFSKELVDVSKSQLDIIKQQVDRTGKLVEAGSLAKGSLLEIQAQESSEELSLVNAQNQLDIAYLTLTQLLYLDSVGNFEIEVPSIDIPSEQQILIPVSDIYKQAVETLPQIKSADFQRQSAEMALKAAKGARSPRLSLSASYGTGYSDIRDKLAGYNEQTQVVGHTTGGEAVTSTYQVPVYESYPISQQFKDNASTVFTLGLSIPIFNGWMANNAISNSKLRAQSAQYYFDDSKNQLYKQVQQAYADARAALKKYNAADKALEAQQESFKYTEQKYTVGLVNSVEYNTAKNQLIKTNSDLLQAKYDYIFRTKILDFYMGKPITLK
ncbi:MAG TPA: TolC family protein [Bacteroidales bacterium]|nr:TolC family protein [Bacteroidales bacterium]